MIAPFPGIVTSENALSGFCPFTNKDNFYSVNITKIPKFFLKSRGRPFFDARAVNLPLNFEYQRFSITVLYTAPPFSPLYPI